LSTYRFRSLVRAAAVVAVTSAITVLGGGSIVGTAFATAPPAPIECNDYGYGVACVWVNFSDCQNWRGDLLAQGWRETYGQCEWREYNYMDPWRNPAGYLGGANRP